MIEIPTFGNIAVEESVKLFNEVAPVVFVSILGIFAGLVALGVILRLIKRVIGS